jgi:phosphotriesterase-related protein
MMTQWNYLHIHDDVLPYVRERGVSDQQIETMLVKTPRCYFENNSAY